jgi:alkanesulfonate monooxygenase SsuD/methylene tetrahydromethanopterin reductase-like flavin-dependent oxidoreductase (luciferase family)
MKFGVFLMPQHPRSDDPVRRFRETVQLAQAARDAGFDCVAAGHHYLSPPYQSLQSVPLLSRLAGDTGSMDLCLSVLLLALLNPVQVAEDIASLDIMSEGRVVFGIGIGYREVEYEGFGMKRQDRVPRMLEALELIKRLWTEDSVTHEGRFFRLHDATCTIRPVQKPLPPIWIAANADQAVVRTARMGLPWFINPHAALPTIERQWQRYKQALAEANQPMPSQRPIALELHIADSREQAVETARPFLMEKYNAYAEWGTRRCRGRKASASRSMNWPATALYSARRTRRSKPSRSASAGWNPTTSFSGSAGPAWRRRGSGASSN